MIKKDEIRIGNIGLRKWVADKIYCGEIVQYYTEDSDYEIEYALTIVFLTYSEDEPDMKSVGGRWARLDDKDATDFKEVVEWFYRNWKKKGFVEIED